MLKSLLIANRGEIACRIIRTARAMGIRTIAVHSDADAHALHVRLADQAVAIGPPPAAQSYLAADRLLKAAREAGAEAIHPGYGFLSENVDFAAAVQAAGLIWVGPNPQSIRAMGRKDLAKARMQVAGVPVTPGDNGADQSLPALQQAAAEIGYPVLIKAVAGGGGKGMRRVDKADDFADLLDSCRREAAAAFGDERVLLEKFVAHPRHIEVQIFGDTHGNVVHLFERDCSLQRRHQKVIEEAPAPGMDAPTRAAICAIAVRAAQAVSYVGAGTVEFIADARDGLRPDRIWFMEMNTRLQVEHPVTEAITGIDLVEWQLRVAAGEPLPRTQAEIALDGWAMEARLYAENPARDFLPATGRIEHFTIGGDVRTDTGVEAGSTITPFYDPMIAKLIAHGPTRDAARTRLHDAIAHSCIWPQPTNAGFLVRLLAQPEFAAARHDTGLIARHIAELLPPERPSEAALAQAAGQLTGAQFLPGFRLNAVPQMAAQFLLGGAPIEIRFAATDTPPQARILITEAGQSWALTPWRLDAGSGGAAGDGSIVAPIPGRITSLAAKAGARVAKGERLLTLEAMKMEYALVAPFAGTVAELNAALDAQVSEGALLARIEGDG